MLVATAILALATVAVGLTAGADGPFSIAVRPSFLHLGLDLDIKLGSMHLHAHWSALPGPETPSSSTQPSADEI